MACIFLDESGQFNKNDDGVYFIVGSFTVGNPRRTEKSFRSWCKSRFPKKMRNRPEMVDSSTSPNIQIADWIVGALAHYKEGRENGEEYMNILKDNILGEGKELFKEAGIKYK